MSKKPYEGSCDKQQGAFGYSTFGFYFNSSQGSRLNFCDVHKEWSNLTLNWHPAMYTGPGQALKDVDFDPRNPKVRPSLRISNGGWAHFLEDLKYKQYDFYLFGPVLFQGETYGTLILELQGYEEPIVTHKVGGDDKVHYQVTYPSSQLNRHRPCTVLGSDAIWKDHDVGLYVQGTNSTLSWNKDLLKAKRKATKVSFPKGTAGAVWTIKRAAALATQCDMYQENG